MGLAGSVLPRAHTWHGSRWSTQVYLSSSPTVAACGFTPQMSSSVSCVAIACCTPGWTRAEQLGSPTQVSLGELNLPSPALPPK